MDPKRAPAKLPPVDADAYVARLNRQVGEVLREWREARGLSAYALAKVARVTDQTILNIEQGGCPNGPLTGTLARLCVYFVLVTTSVW